MIENLRWDLDSNGNLCKKTNDTLVLAMIYSSPSNFERREFIRKSWGNNQLFNEVKMK